MTRSELDILSISETWLTDNIENRLTTVPGYGFIRADRKTVKGDGRKKRGGGLGIYYKNSLEVDPDKYMHLNESRKDLELQWMVLSRPNTKKILIGNVYRPPNGNLAEALELIGEALDKIEGISKYEVLIIGDFNADYLDKKGLQHTLIKGFEAEHQLQQMIQDPTRYSNKTQTMIDLAFTNIKFCTGAGVLNYNISDHKAIYVIKKKDRNCKAVETHIGRSYKKLNREALSEILRRKDTRRVTLIGEPNQCWEELEKILVQAADELCPVKELKIRTHTVEYLTPDLLGLQRDRDHYAKIADRSRDPGDKFVSKCLIKRTSIAVDRAKANHHQTVAEELNQNHKKYWDNMEKAEPKAQAKINGLVDEQTGERIADKDLPEKINNSFAGIGAKLAEKFQNIDLKDKIYIPKMNNKEYDIEQVTEQEVIKIIRKLPVKKASGIKNMNTEFMALGMEILIQEFTYLYNLIIDKGVFPDAWKIATVTPIPKVAHPKTCGELRPISILPLPGRIMVKIMGTGMMGHLEDTNYLPDEQNGFRKNRSTTKSVATLVDVVSQALDDGYYAVTIFLDLKKAFDTVDHKILMWKLKRAGMGPRILKLLASYLTNRHQRTKLNNQLSSCKPVTTGVPQGSTLGPMLYTICSGDLPEISEELLYTIYADDTTMTIIDKSLTRAAERMNSIMPKATRWFNENKLTVNLGKTEYMVFGSKQRLAKAEPIKIKLGGQELKRVESYRYLGTTLDTTLNATKQLAKLNQLMAQKLISFRKIRQCLSEKSAIVIYKATIVPIFDYNDLIYNLLNQQQLTKLQRLQNRALRLVFKGRILSVAEMHERAKVEYLAQRRETHLVALMFNRKGDEKYKDQTERVTRRGEAVLLKVPRAKTNKLMKAPIYSGSTLWNSLPVRVRQSKTKLELKNLYRMHRAGQLLEWREEEEDNETSIIVE